MNYKLYLLKEKLITKLEDFLMWVCIPIQKYYASPKSKEREHKKYVKSRINKLKKDIFHYIKKQGEVSIMDEFNRDNGRYTDIDFWSNFNAIEDVEYLMTTNFFQKNGFKVTKTTLGEFAYKSYIENSVKDKLIYVIKK